MDNSIQAGAGRAMMAAQIQAYKAANTKPASSPNTKEGPNVAGASPAYKISISNEGKAMAAETKKAVSATDVDAKVRGNSGDADLITGDASPQEKASYAKVEGTEDGVFEANGVVRPTLDDYKAKETRANNLETVSEADLRTMESDGDITKADVEKELEKRDEGSLKEAQKKDQQDANNEVVRKKIEAYQYQANFSTNNAGVA